MRPRMRLGVVGRLIWAVPVGLVTVIAAWLVWGASDALAGSCTGAMSGQIQGPLDVPDGATCTLASGASVVGATTVEGSLTASGVSFEGAFTATGAGPISVRGSALAGAVSVTGDSGAVDFSLDAFYGAATLRSNIGGLGLAGDSFTSTLDCENNTPPPHDGGSNRFSDADSPTGQCAGFGGLAGGPVPTPTPTPSPSPTPTPTVPSKPAPKPATPAPKFVRVIPSPVFHHGSLVVRVRCPGTPGACKETLRFRIATGRHKVLTRRRHVSLGRGKGERITLHLGGMRPLHARLRVTVDRQAIFNGLIRIRR
jgi:hypothetical protein